MKKEKTCEICGYHHREYRPVTKTRKGQWLCEACRECPDCDAKLVAPRKSWEGRHAQQCPKCHAEFLKIRKARKLIRLKGGMVPMVKRSSLDYRLKFFARLEKPAPSGVVVRVIEIGMFYVTRSGANFYSQVSQIGAADFHIDPDDKKPNLKKWHPVRETVRQFPDLTSRWNMRQERIERIINKLRGMGWRLVSSKDGNGRTERVYWQYRLTKAEHKRSEESEKFDEEAGKRHQTKLERINEKYAARGNQVATDWLGENIGTRA